MLKPIRSILPVVCIGMVLWLQNLPAMPGGISSVAPQRTDYGVPCIVCDRSDNMTMIGYEQVGFGGTLYRIYYRCGYCGAVTSQDVQAR